MRTKELFSFLKKKRTTGLTALLVMLSLFFLASEVYAVDEYAGEKITYGVKPFGGWTEYNDLGIIDFNGKPARLVIFKTEANGLKDTEKIYSSTDYLSPIRVERDVAWFGRETITEEYDQKNYTVTIKKVKGKKISTQVLRADGPINHAILLSFFPRTIPQLDVGWSFTIRLPQKFEVKLVSIDDIKVYAKRYKAYHFISIPDKFEIWVNTEHPRVPVKIKGKKGFSYSLLLKEYQKLGEGK
jgi:hypothetical protein